MRPTIKELAHGGTLENLNLHFDESGDPIKGIKIGNHWAVFFVGCVSSEDSTHLEQTYDSIASSVGDRNRIHYKDLSPAQRSTVWKQLMVAELELDVALTLTPNWKQLRSALRKRQEAVAQNNPLSSLQVGRAQYAEVSHMCHTEMAAKIAWLIFANDANIEDTANYEKTLRVLQDNKGTISLEYDLTDNIKANVWKDIHLGPQLNKYGFNVEPLAVKSKGCRLADILVSGFKDFLKNHPNRDLLLNNLAIIKRPYSDIKISKFYTNGQDIRLVKPRFAH